MQPPTGGGAEPPAAATAPAPASMVLSDNDRAAINHYLANMGTFSTYRIDNTWLAELLLAIDRNIGKLNDARDLLALAEGRHERYIATLRRAVG